MTISDIAVYYYERQAKYKELCLKITGIQAQYQMSLLPRNSQLMVVVHMKRILAHVKITVVLHRAIRTILLNSLDLALAGQISKKYKLSSHLI